MASHLFWRMIISLCVSGVLFCVIGCRESQEKDKGFAPHAPVRNKYGGVYHRPLGQEPLTLDPALVTDRYAVAIVQQVFDGLVQFDADLNVIPSLAKTWNASPDSLVWTFQLRQGVKFHHGREVTAEDFVYSLTRLVDPKTASPRARLFEHIQGAKQFMTGESRRLEGLRAIDRYTLEITLSQPYAPFITMLGIAQPKVVPREEVERLGPEFGRHPVGTGPFRFVKWVAGQEITLTAYRHYFEERPFLDRLHYRILGNAQEILTEFEQGRLEEAELPAQDRQRLIADSRFQFFRKPFLATLFLWMNTHEGPLSNRKVRQAINYAIDREMINNTIRKKSVVQAQGILPLGMPGHNPDLQGYSYDVLRAKQLLAEAGYPEGQGFPHLEIWTSTAAKTALDEHEEIKRNLEHLGLVVELKTADSWKHFQTTILGKRPGALYRHAWFADFPDPDNFLSVLFHSQGPTNYANYKNPEVDQLLEQAQREHNDARRIELYRHAEALIVADAPTVNLVYYTLERLFQPYVRGIVLNALGEPYIPMKKVWLDTPHHDSPMPAQTP